MNTTHPAETKARTRIADRDSANLITDFQAAGRQMDTADQSTRLALADIRGWIMDELDARENLGLLAVAEGLCPTCWSTLGTCECH